jgi:hypothetical protein
MGRMRVAEQEALGVFVPVVHDPGGFRPVYCCRCAAKLVSDHAHYFEGPVCLTCDILVRGGCYLRSDADERAEGGLS